jgi:ATP-dependent Clp endopeptidase proteolytic subunit ClpP
MPGGFEMPQKWYEIKAAAGAAEIWIYEEIGFWGTNANDFAAELKALTGINDINLHINSPGGSVWDGTAIYNLLKNHPAQVTAYIDGIALSMASVIAMAADLIIMPENAMMMIHNPLMMAQGDAAQLRKNADLLDKTKSALISAYVNRTGLPEQQISDMMDAETWMTGTEAVALGFADETGPAIAVAAHAVGFDLSKFEHTPEILSAVAGTPRSTLKETPMLNPTKPATGHTADELENARKQAAEEARQQAIRDEEERRNGIVAAFGDFSGKHGELLNKCLMDSKCTVDNARQRLLDKLGEGVTPTAGGAIIVGDENNIAKIQAMGEVLQLRAGVAKDADVGRNPYRGSTLLDMARQCLEMRSVSMIGMDKMAIVAAAFTHSSGDFGNILSDTANKAMLKGYGETPETFEQFTSVGSLPDFKSMKKVGLNNAPSLRKVPENSEFKYVTFGDRGEVVQLATYGSLFNISRQAIINDDLNAFSKIPQNFGRAARRTVGDLVFDILINGQLMSDGVELFHADHNNLLNPGGLTAASFGAGRSAMAKQKDPGGNGTLNIRVANLVVPVALEDTAKVLMASQYDPSKTQKVPNPAAGGATVISDARLDAASETTWFQLADPNMYDGIEVQYLDGNPNPTLEQQMGWNVDGTEFKVRLDAGAKALDYRTLVKNT